MILIGLAVGWIGGHTVTALTAHQFGASADASVPGAGGPIIQGSEVDPWASAIHIKQKLAKKRPTLQKLVFLADAMKEQGATAPEIARLLHYMAEASSVTIFGRPDVELQKQELAARAQNLETLKHLWAARTNPKKWAELQGKLSKEDPNLNVFFFHNDKHRSELEDDIGTSQAYDASSAIALSSWIDYDWLRFKIHGRNSPADLAEARAGLEQAVHDVGIAAWKVPAVRWARADLLQQDAKNLRQANQELEKITGWHGAVLGLNNRLILNNNASGDGKTSLAIDQQHIVVWSTWESMSHEWFHALDDTLGKEGGVLQWHDSQVSSRSETGLMRPEEGKNNWISSSFTENFSRWHQRMGQFLEGRYHAKNDEEDTLAVQSFRTLWSKLAQPHLSSNQAAEILNVLKNRKEQLGGLSKKQTENHKAVSGEILLFGSARSSLANTSVENLMKIDPGTSPWFQLRILTQEQIKKALPTVKLKMADGGYRFDEDSVSDYVTDPTEILAYAFAGQVSAGISDYKGALVDPVIQGNKRPEWNITQPESKATEPAWRSFFKTLGPWWKQDQSVRLNFKEPASTSVDTELSNRSASRKNLLKR